MNISLEMQVFLQENFSLISEGTLRDFEDLIIKIDDLELMSSIQSTSNSLSYVSYGKNPANESKAPLNFLILKRFYEHC
jgi:hypothetical protein